jgi:hypothetical protein
MDTTIWRFIKWESGKMEIYCSGCFTSELLPYIQYFHYPDSRWIKTSLGSFRVVALGMDAVGKSGKEHAGCTCSVCGDVRRNELFVHKHKNGSTREIKA